MGKKTTAKKTKASPAWGKDDRAPPVELAEKKKHVRELAKAARWKEVLMHHQMRVHLSTDVSV